MRPTGVEWHRRMGGWADGRWAGCGRGCSHSKKSGPTTHRPTDDKPGKGALPWGKPLLSNEKTNKRNSKKVKSIKKNPQKNEKSEKIRGGMITNKAIEQKCCNNSENVII